MTQTDFAGGWQTIEMVVTVKAYPAISNKYGESVCVAGVRTDTQKNELVRLFPVGFRDLEPHMQFKKYQHVTLRAKKGTTDRRPESWQPDLGSLKLGSTIDTSRKWHDRWELVHDLAGEFTTCEIRERAAKVGQNSRSLALIKPADVSGVIVTTNPAFDRTIAAAAAMAAAPDLFQNEKDALRAAPYRLQYEYRCQDRACSGHSQSLIDWEVGAAGLKWRDGKSGSVADQLKRKFYDDMCGSDRDVHFFIGNQHQNPGSFMVIGVFWPPQHSKPSDTLF
ncbi:hypothetical protein JOF48_003065 [Arthrobacter stackebrandtii]|uniref:Uncharacterized protein n=1 Tax=Arthrobacter stackebrandtii TaxID=272161 RepID=A0ABS4YZN0_9MICC|nr:hypothetical protein [Arthrobacter stackebrandtii]MBP2414266.1 hypothetical protein [Arthrobacter stackebrandtii]PYH01431.1 hypothetical protein CVV67_02700 [Arthrobacter stackebrandtii]